MLLRCFFVCVHGVFVPCQELQTNSIASMMAHQCSSLALFARPALPVRMRDFVAAAVWSSPKSCPKDQMARNFSPAKSRSNLTAV
jgi:hypothetical protein